jgi:type VI protein secretion system component VasK
VLDLQRQLKGVPDDLIREALAGSGHQHLLAPPATSLGPETFSKGTKSTNDPLSPSRASADTEDAAMIARVDKIIAQRMDKLTKDAFKSLTQRRLHTLVESQLPVAAELFLNGAVADHRDQFYEDCKTNEVTVREHIDEGVTEIRDVTNECTKELSDLAQQCMDSLDEHSRNIDASAEQELSKLKRWFAELAKGFSEKQISVGSASLNKTRRISM